MSNGILRATDTPFLLMGGAETTVENSGRLSIPARWKDIFDDKGYLARAKMGEITYAMLFPEDNLAPMVDLLLGEEEYLMADTLVRSANPVAIDKQSRLVIPNDMGLNFSGGVTLLGAVSHLQILPTNAAEGITAQDAEIMHSIGRLI